MNTANSCVLFVFAVTTVMTESAEQGTTHWKTGRKATEQHSDDLYIFKDLNTQCLYPNSQLIWHQDRDKMSAKINIRVLAHTHSSGSEEVASK